MKKILLVFCLLSATAAFAQYGGPSTLSGSGISAQVASHPAHASYMAMSTEQSVLPNVGYSSAQGERPASDFPQQEAVPLGTAARELKKEHAQLKKSRFVWVNQ
jgi:hypothetical protein